MAVIDALTASPALLPIERIGDVVRVKRMDEGAYRRASFLDQRLFQSGDGEAAIAWSDLEGAALKLPKQAQFIFHIGHVGSTLLARLLGEHEAVFCLREPAMLRPIAQPARPITPAAMGELEVLLRLFSRTWRPGRRALIKTTSFVSELAPDLLAQVPDARAIALGTTPPAYLRVILGGPQSRREIEAMADLRLSRLQARLGSPVIVRSEGERIAMSWLCETLCLHQTASHSGGRLMGMDFDRFLSDPAAELGRAFDHLGVKASSAWIEGLARSELMSRYSKGPEHAYDADLRREVMAQAERTHGDAFRAGMDWLQRMAEVHPPVVGALRQAAAARRNGV